MSINVQALEHLGYEWWMFRATCATARRDLEKPPTAERNAVVEAAAKHGRALLRFFYRAKHSDFAQVWNVTDLGDEFAVPDEMPDRLWRWYCQSCKYVGPLTDARSRSLRLAGTEMIEAALGHGVDEVRAKLGSAIPSHWPGNRNSLGELRLLRSPRRTGSTTPRVKSEQYA